MVTENEWAIPNRRQKNVTWNIALERGLVTIVALLASVCRPMIESLEAGSGRGIAGSRKGVLNIATEG